MSPGIIAMYWLLASIIATAVITRTAHVCKRATRRATGPRCCGMCDR